MSEMHQLTASSRDGRKQPIGVHFWSSARPVSMKFIDGAGRWPAITRPFVNVFSCGLHRSIAADTLYISSFGSEEIGRNAELQFLENSNRTLVFCFEFLAADRLLRSDSTQKTFDEAVGGLSNDT